MLLTNGYRSETGTNPAMNKRYIRQADNASLAREVREHQERERAEVRDVVAHGSPEDRRALAAKNHVGVGRVHWQPGRARRA